MKGTPFISLNQSRSSSCNMDTGNLISMIFALKLNQSFTGDICTDGFNAYNNSYWG